MNRRALITLPNTISLSRVVLALAFVLVSEPWDRIALIAVAGFTDIIDGWLARHEKSESTAGALLDPLADRVFVLVAISTYLIEGRLTTGQYFHLPDARLGHGCRIHSRQNYSNAPSRGVQGEDVRQDRHRRADDHAHLR